jgi:hypothetical protein
MTSGAELDGNETATALAIGLRTNEFDPTMPIAHVNNHTGFIILS